MMPLLELIEKIQTWGGALFCIANGYFPWKRVCELFSLYAVREHKGNFFSLSILPLISGQREP